MKKFVYALIILAFAFDVKAQEAVPIIKPEVYDSYVMFRKTVKRRMDLEEKQNRPFNSKNGEISRLIIEAVNDGLLRPYRSDSCLNQLTDEEFADKIRVELQGGGGGGFGSGGFGGGFGNQQSAQPTGPQYQNIPEEYFSVLTISEDVIFDRNRSRMYYYIRSIGLWLPASAGVDFNPGQFEKNVAYFKYEDLVSLFRGPYADRAIWYNNTNVAAHINFGDAFELRLFSAPITYISNAQNLDILQQYQNEIQRNPIVNQIISQKYEYDLMEYESELWEY